MKKIVLGITLSLFIIGCTATKNEKVSKQTALTWHKIIFKNLSPFDLDTADDAFTSLEVEHPESQFIPIDMIQLSLAHAKSHEFELAIFYMQEFKKRYASYGEKKWADYMISKYKFFSIEEPYTNQQGLDDALNFIKKTIETYSDSIYNYELNTMKTKLRLTKKLFRQNISELYKRIDKPKAAEIYKTDIDKNTIIPPHIPWYKRIFYW